MDNKKQTNIKIPFISKHAYGFGDIGCNFSWMFVEYQWQLFRC